MQGNKFKFKKDYYNVMSGMTDKQAGEFIKGVCAYVFDGKAFVTKDAYLKGLFLYVKRELDVSKMNSENGRKGGVICAENRQTNERKTAFGNAVVTGGFVAERAMETIIDCLKNVRDEKVGERGGSGQK